MVNVAVYPGSFDPVSLGHIDIIERAAKIFDKVIVAVLINTDKKGFFPIAERIEMVKLTTEHIPNVEVRGFSGLTVNFLKEVDARVIIRGLRVVSDFDFELQMGQTNHWLADEIELVCLFANAPNHFFSATLVRQVATLGGDATNMVPPPVAEALRELKKKA